MSWPFVSQFSHWLSGLSNILGFCSVLEISSNDIYRDQCSCLRFQGFLFTDHSRCTAPSAREGTTQLLVLALRQECLSRRAFTHRKEPVNAKVQKGHGGLGQSYSVCCPPNSSLPSSLLLGIWQVQFVLNGLLQSVCAAGFDTPPWSFCFVIRYLST